MSYIAAENRYNAMPYRRVGRSGLVLPALSLGLWHNFGDSTPLDNQRALLRTAFDLGINHFDLANNYGPPYGSAEINFGRLLREDFKGYRDELIISSKAGWDMWPGPYGQGGGSRKYILASLDQSLARLGLDYVDISILLLSLSLLSGVASAGGTTEAGIGGALGGVLGSVVGQSIGGSTGSAIGAGLGGAAGSAVGADKRSRGEAAIGGALGAAGGNVVGRSMGGNTGSLIGAAAGGGAGGALGNYMGNKADDDDRRYRDRGRGYDRRYVHDRGHHYGHRKHKRHWRD